MAFPKPINDMS